MISDKATVTPPPVKGYLILNESPSKSAPRVGYGAAGMLLFAIVLMFPSSIADMKALESSKGI